MKVNGVIYPNKPKEQDAFTAGWYAHQEHIDHDWGPAPADNPRAAKKVWENTCHMGHTSRVNGCSACNRMKS